MRARSFRRGFLMGLLLFGLSSSAIADADTILSVNPGDLVISEVAWMGTAANTAHEWIELYNTTNQAINLNGWRVISLTDSSPNFTISSVNCSNLTIPAKGFFLLERTSNSTVNDIAADCIYTGALSDTGEALALRDSLSNTIDTANGDGGGWPAGTTSPRATMERIDLSAADSDANWDTNDGVHRNGLDANNNPLNGTPKAPRQRASFNALDVVITEVAWMGTQADANDEWIELYNNTNQAINLNGWKLIAADGTPSLSLNSSICSNLTIPAKGFFLLERTSDSTVSDTVADCIYTGALSNSGEALSLKDPANNTIDTANGNEGPWPAGHEALRATMERLDPLAPDSDVNWATNNQIHRNGRDANNNFINGTPKAHKPPYLTIASPTTSAPVYRKQGESLNVSFTTDEAGAYAIKVDGSNCDAGSAGAGSHTKICTLPASFSEGAKTLAVEITDNTATLGSRSQVNAIIVDNTPPTVTLLTPNGGELLPANSTFNITWTLCSDLNLAGTPVELRYSTDGGVSFPNLITAATENDGSFTWNLPTINSSTARVRVICTDFAGNSAQDDSDANFTIASLTLGDVNDDGVINTLDARMAQQHADGVITLTGNAFLAADVDVDSDVDSNDATAIAKRGIGLPTGIPGFALGPHPRPLSVNGEGWPGVRWLFLTFTLPALALLRRHRKIAMLALISGLGLLTGCVGFLGLPPPGGPAIYLTSTSMPNGATRHIDLIVQQITTGGGAASLQGRITYPSGVAIQLVTGLNGFIVKAICGTVGDPCASPGELRLSLVKPSAGGVSNGAILRLAVQASGASGQVYTLNWAGSAQAPIVLGSNANSEITGFSTGNGQVKVR